MDQRSEPRYRTSVPCTLFVNRRYLGLYWADEISIAGAFLARVDFFEVGSTLEISVHVPALRTVLLRATVIRCSKDGCAVSFDRRDWMARNAIIQALAYLRQPRAHTKPALLVTRKATLARVLGDEIAQHDVEPLYVTSPVETFWRLSDAIGTVILDLDFLNGSCEAWLDLLARDFPRVTRAIVTDQPVPPHIADALSCDRLDAILTVPWRSSYLRKVITCCRPPTARRADDSAWRAGAPAVFVPWQKPRPAERGVCEATLATSSIGE